MPSQVFDFNLLFVYSPSLFLTLRVLNPFLKKHLGLSLSFTFPNNLEIDLIQEILGVSFLDIPLLKMDISATMISQKDYISPRITPSLKVNLISYTLIFNGEIGGIEDKISKVVAMNDEGVLPQLVDVPNVFTLDFTSIFAII